MRTFLSSLIFAIGAIVGAGELSYYERFMSLLDSPSADLTTKVPVSEDARRSVTNGMSISDAVAVIGKPRYICLGSLEHTELSYSSQVLDFKVGASDEELTAQGLLNEVKVQTPIGSRAYGGDKPYGAQLKSLLDPSNPGPDFTKAPLPLANLRRGEIFGVKLDMTMDSVVAVWGKPVRIFGSTRRLRLLYPECGLTFVAAKLQELDVSGNFVPALKFDNDLTGQMNEGQFKKVLGIPTEERVVGAMGFERDGIVVEFSFAVLQDGGTMVSSDETKMTGAKLNRVSVRYKGNQSKEIR